MSNTTHRNSLLCPGCRKLISRSTPTCPYCQLSKPGSRLKSNLLTSWLSRGDGFVKSILAVNIAMFILSILIDPRLSSLHFSPFNFLSPSNQSLLILGSTGSIPLFELNRWWSLLTANYLHGGLLHILFNMLAIRQLAPLVIQEYGVSRAVVLYTIGGAGGFFFSSLAGVGFTIGASAALCSLIGAMLYYGKSRGGNYGQAVFSQIGGWALSIAIIGFLLPGINNWGHGGGMLCGILLGYLLGYTDKRREHFSHKALAMLCLFSTVLVLLWSCFNGLIFVLLSHR